MTTEINPDHIDIDYHINNLELFFFNVFYPLVKKLSKTN